MRTFWKPVAAGAVSAGLLALPAGVGAAPVISAPLQKCYTALPPRGAPSIPIALSGGTPGDSFQVVISPPRGPDGGLGSVTGVFGPSGNGSATLTDVYPASRTANPLAGEVADLSVIDFTGGGGVTTPLGSVLITNRALNPGFSRTSQKAHYVSVSGTQFANKPLYGFLVHNRRVVRRFSVGRGNVCGYARRKLTLVSKHTPLGRYVLFINPGDTLDRGAAISEAYKVELL